MNHVTLRHSLFVISKTLIIIAQVLYDEFWYKLTRDRSPLKKEEDVEGEVVVITGATRGIGKATAFEFAKRRAIVVLACRNIQNAQLTMEEIRNKIQNAKLDAFPIDLMDMDSVERFSKAVGAKYPKIKILVNNAGVIGDECSDPSILTKDGLFNPAMAANYFGHFLLTNLLLENLKMSIKPRVVVLTSILQRLGYAFLDLNDLTMQKSGFGLENGLPYGNSKFCGSLFAKELGERMKREGSELSVYSVCPSLVESGMTSNRHDSPSAQMIKVLRVFGFGFSYEQDISEFIMHSCLSKKLGQRESGLMYQYRQPCGRCNPKLEQEKETREKLWDISARLVKLEERLESKKQKRKFL